MVVAALFPFGLLAFDKPDLLETKLRSALGARKGAQFTWDEDTLVVRFRMIEVKVPQPTKMRTKIPRPIISIEQPTLTGFKVEVREMPHPPHHELPKMQAVRANPNWIRDYGTYKMDVGRRQFEGKELYYTIEWGSQVDPKLLGAIRKVLKG